MTELSERAIIWEMVKGIRWPVWAFSGILMCSAARHAYDHSDWTIVLFPTLAAIVIIGQAVSISGSDMLIGEYKKMRKGL